MIGSVIVFRVVTALLGGLAGVCAVNTLYYSTFPPSLARAQSQKWLPDWLASTFQGAAFGLSVLRLPYIFLPYGIKVVLAVAARTRFQALWDSRIIQVIRLLGDFANFVIVSALLAGLPRPMLVIVVSAELIRLLAEKGQTVFSGIWQLWPHRDRYYALDAQQRLESIVGIIDAYGRQHPEVAQRMASFKGFEIMPESQSLRTGRVRDIASGRVYVHQRWLNDPYLLIGLALRRTPWIFDPRFLPRPFYYRSQANTLMTRFVLRCAPLTPPFAWYQFGHEIKAARFTIFFRLMRGLGFPIEDTVRADGSYEFDPLLRWVGRRLGWIPSEERSHLLTDHELIDALKSMKLLPENDEIARRYAYPGSYVSEVLRPALEASRSAPEESAG